jgi:hypothetical protein
LDWLAAVLTYLLPGLGQIIQGRIGKGLLYFFCLMTLFYYGQYLGKWRIVHLPNCSNLPTARLPILGELTGLPRDLFYRKEFIAQFWMGLPSWPAIIQYRSTEPLPQPSEDDGRWQPNPHPILGRYMQPISEYDINRLQANSNRYYDLGWVMTIIAGALNILVIYDALAGPLVKFAPVAKKEDGGKS